jgi:hypothetical protein
LVRAEALFRRFQRVVEAIDRQDNFPPPSSVRQRKPIAGDTLSTPEAHRRSSSVNDSRRTPALLNKQTSPPAPSSSQPETTAGSSTSVSSPSDVAKGKRKSVGQSVRPLSVGSPPASEKKVVSPELRALLSRDVPKISKDEVKEHGGGVGS